MEEENQSIHDATKARLCEHTSAKVLSDSMCSAGIECSSLFVAYLILVTIRTSAKRKSGLPLVFYQKNFAGRFHRLSHVNALATPLKSHLACLSSTEC